MKFTCRSMSVYMPPAKPAVATVTSLEKVVFGASLRLTLDPKIGEPHPEKVVHTILCEYKQKGRRVVRNSVVAQPHAGDSHRLTILLGARSSNPHCIGLEY